MEISIKDLAKDTRKIAFSIAFGLGLGKLAAEVVACTVHGIVAGSLAALANNGNAWAQELCRKHSIEHTQKRTDGKPCDTEEKE